MKKGVDKYFKQHLDVPHEPPSDSWAYIQQHISKKEKETKRIIPFWLNLSGIAVAVLLLLGTGYLIGINSNSSNSQSSNLQKIKEADVTSLPVQKSKNNQKFDKKITISDHQINKNNTNNSTDNHYLNNNYLYVNHKEILETELENNNYTQEFQLTNSMNNYDTENYDKTKVTVLESLNYNHQNELQKSINGYAKIASVSDLNTLLQNISSGNLQEELVVKEEKQEIAKSTKNKNKKKDFDRFSISGFASPMALNTFVGKSMLADEMSQYTTENNITLAYGFKAAYSVNPRLKVRTGLSVIGFEQITKDVPLSTDFQGFNNSLTTNNNAVENVNYNGQIRIESTSAVSFNNVDLADLKVGNGNIQQQSSYLEIPIEAEYRLFQTNSIAISATGGGSTWLLSKNKIYVHTDDYTEELGKANNLNEVSFSANAGLKFDLNLSEKVNMNIEPNFKYLVNPVNNIEKYNPYTVGVNAGISVSLE